MVAQRKHRKTFRVLTVWKQMWEGWHPTRLQKVIFHCVQHATAALTSSMRLALGRIWHCSEGLGTSSKPSRWLQNLQIGRMAWFFAASRLPPVLSFKLSSVSSLKFLWSKRAQFKRFNDAENRSLYIMEFWVRLKIRVSTGTVSLGVKHQFVPYHKLHLLYHGTGLSPTLYCSRNLSNCNHFLCVFFSTKGWPFPILTTFWPWHIKSSCLNNVPEISRCHMELPWYLRLGNAGVHRRCNQGLLAIDKSDELRTFNALRPGQ